ncbi:MAG: calcium-translocating P-type ATPase, PMCA-type [Phascolarctobacterium sp.]|nr:calcium-translocating P-type ATPase, PMCA-type [Phascolarctobacterium sp.]
MQKYGLNSQQVQRSQVLHGRNILPQPQQQSFLKKLGENLQDPMIKILLVALLINMVFAYSGQGDWVESIGILVAILLAVLVSTWSEYSNENAFQRLQAEASRTQCRVWRDGKPQAIPVEEVVVDDAVILQAGDKVPADGCLLEGKLQVDQSTLNGESEPAEKISRAIHKEQAENTVDLLNQHQLFRGSVVVEGNGIMLVQRIGADSLYGQLTQELKDEERESPLKLKLKALAKQISRLGYSGGVLIALAVMLHKMLVAGGWNAYTRNWDLVVNDLLQAIILGIIIIVMAVPEGLPLMIAIVSSLNMRKMLRDNVLVRKLVGIETAGSLNILFTDKTGTITKGHLQVVSYLSGEGKEYYKLEELPATLKAYTIQQALLNTSASYSKGQLVGGNMTEAALGSFAGKVALEIMPQRLELLPFNSSNKYSLAIVQDAGRVYGLVKGAPEVLLPKVTYYWGEDDVHKPFTEEQRQHLDARMNALAGKAMRLLALCSFETNAAQQDKGGAAGEGTAVPERGWTLMGIVAIRDDVRQEAVDAIKAVQRAGVQVVMITGDRKETAMAIAKDAGLLHSQEELVWTSSELAQLSDDEVKAQLAKLRVVARALPLDKLRLVRLAQELNLVAGMTGDGVNDAPALKRADVGFAMGSGTEVAKEAGDIVILDDNFLSIKQAILYGRTIYNNIRKFIVFQLTINFAAVMTSFIAPFLGIDKPLTITQILWINLVMDTLAALAFGGEPALAAYMQEQPKRRSADIINKRMLQEIILGGSVMTVLGLAFFKSSWVDGLFRNAPDHIYTYTGFFSAFICMAVANAFNVRAEGVNVLKNLQQNPAFLQVMLVIVAVQVGMTYLGGSLLRTAPLQGQEWLVVVACACVMLLGGTLHKLGSRK